MSAEKTLLQRVKPLAEEYAMFPEGGNLLCCVSGGVDSISLLHFLAGQARLYGFHLYACHFDHKTQPHSAEDARFVQAQCEALGMPLYLTQEDVPAWASEHHMGVEEAGRRLRYAWFESLAWELEPCLIATAHNADDNAETLLLHLVRGTGLSGLGGIPPRRGNLVRPFLQAPRALIVAYAEEKGIPHVEDETNADPDYSARNLLRNRVMPLLRQLNPNLTDTMTASAASLRQDGDFLAARAAAVAMDAKTAAGSVILPLDCVTTQSTAIAVRVVQLAAEKLDPDLVLTAAQRRAVLDLCRGDDPSAHCDLPGGMVAQRVYTTLVFSYPGRVEILPPTQLDFTGSQEIGPWQVTVEPKPCPEDWKGSKTEFYLAADHPVLLRPRQTGDELRLGHREGTKSLKKWFIELRIPEARRSLVPVLEQQGAVAAVYGLGTHRDALPQPGRDCLHITIRERERN